ncbi:hypothetical protein RYH70_00985 [Alloalcanivorax xenomutans]|uniref:hypothetical protein n=1 Tax=Alloalcanivorax xenomutans TaxID=1094342 RepID=UPI0004BBBFB5|nr:hypothetical protein [Alloalcanivorax xenomutans]WOD28643.1 hypothetical protein RYH70_00985 [Alloalcanivorax xenomutans]
MKYLILILMAVPGLSVASGLGDENAKYPSGMSGSLHGEQSRTYTRAMLNNQAKSGGAEKSELAAPVYVDSQRRLAESFRHSIPESFGEQTRGEN